MHASWALHDLLFNKLPGGMNWSQALSGRRLQVLFQPPAGLSIVFCRDRTE
jgi:hypothetical protein